MLITNEVIKNIIGNDNIGYHTIFMVMRNKDFPNEMPSYIDRTRKEHFIRTWHIITYNELFSKMPKIIEYAKAMNARLYISLDKMSFKKTCGTMINSLVSMLTEYRESKNESEMVKRLTRLTDSITRKQENSIPGYRRWMIDIDNEQNISKIKNNLIKEYSSFVEDIATNGVIFTDEFINKNVIFNPSVTGMHAFGYIRDPNKNYTVDIRVLQRVSKNLGYDFKTNPSTLLYTPF